MKYDAFISYSHEADGALAPAVQTALRQLARPWNRRHALRVFRDDTGLSVTPALWPAIESALQASEYFVLMASPQAAASEWVQKELAYWLAHRGPDRVLPVVTAGEWVWDDSAGDLDFARSTCVPPVLRGAFREEPRHLDLRWARTGRALDLSVARFRDAMAELAAPIHGRPKDELEGEDLRQHRKTVRLRRAAIAGLAVLTVLATAGGVLAMLSRQEAVRQRDAANEQRGIAEERARVAMSRALAATSVDRTDDRHDLALLLAVEAHRTSPTPEAEASVVNALASKPRLEGYLPRLSAAVRALAFSPDATLLAAGGADGAVVIFDVANRSPLRELSRRESPIALLSFSEDGSRLVSVDSARRHFTWTLADWSGQEGTAAPPPPGAPSEMDFAFDVTAMAESPDGFYLAAAAANGDLALLQIGSGSRELLLQGTADGYAFGATAPPVTLSMTWAHAGEYTQLLVTGDDRGEVTLWDPPSDVGRIDAGASDVTSLTYDEAAGVLATGAADGTIALWAIAPEDDCLQAAGRAAPSFACVLATEYNHGHRLSGDGRLLLMTEGVWSIADDRGARVPLNCQLQELRPFGIFQGSFSPSGRFVGCIDSGRDPASGAWRSFVRVVDLTRAAPTREVAASDGVPDFRFVSDVHIGVLAHDDTLRLFDILAGRPHAGEPWAGSLLEGACGGFAFSADGGMLAWGAEGGVRVWRRDEPGARDAGGLPCAEQFAFHPTGAQLAIGKDAAAQLLDLVGQAPPRTLTGHREEVTALAYHPDGEVLATAGADGVVRLWRTATGQPLGGPLAHHTGSAMTLAWLTRDGQVTLVSSGENETILWEFGLDAWIRRACLAANRPLTAEEWREYVGDTRPESACEAPSSSGQPPVM